MMLDPVGAGASRLRTETVGTELEAREAAGWDVDYVGVGPVYATATKPDAGVALGVDQPPGRFDAGISHQQGLKPEPSCDNKVPTGGSHFDPTVEQCASFESAISLETAQALGFTIAQSLLLRADEVIR